MKTFNINDRVRVTEDVTLRGPMTGVIQKGAMGRIHGDGHSDMGLYSVQLDDGFLVLVHEKTIERVDDDNSSYVRQLKEQHAEQVRALEQRISSLTLAGVQLAARDGALDAVLKFARMAHDNPAAFGSGWGTELLLLLQRHGVHDAERGIGKTSEQMRQAPPNSVFVWCNESFEYAIRLAYYLKRADLLITSPRALDAWRFGRRTVVVDHAAQLSERQRATVLEVMKL